MNPHRPRNWDIQVGLCASALAVTGLLASLITGNTESFISGPIAIEKQWLMLVMAGVTLVLIMVKYLIRNRR